MARTVCGAENRAGVDLDTWTKSPDAVPPSLRAAVSDPEEDHARMPTRTRTPNVAAAQWSPNGGALGQADLTQPSASIFGENVFSVAVQRQRLPKAAFRQLEASIAKGEPLEPELPDHGG